MSDYLASLNAWASPFEMGVVVLAFLLLFGADRMPEMLRTLGRWIEKLRRLSDEFRSQILEADQRLTETVKERWAEELQETAVSQSPADSVEGSDTEAPAPAPVDSTEPPA